MTGTIFLLALIGGINFRFGLLSQDAGKYLVGWIVRTLVSLLLAWMFIYLGLPGRCGPTLGFGLPLLVIFSANAAITGAGLGIGSSGGRGSNTAGLGWVIAIIIGLLGYMAVRGVASWECWNALAYHNMLGDPNERKESEDSRIDMSQIRVVSRGQANFKSDKVLGEAGAIGSTYTVGAGTIQDVEGRSYWVAPLGYSGFWRWNAKKNEGTPGWVVVDAQNMMKKAELVTGYHLKYMPSAFFGQDLKRHVYKKYKDVWLLDETFELKSFTEPRWVYTIAKPTIGWSAEKILGVIIVDPQTGDIERYSNDEIPDWVDRVLPDEVTLERVNWYGKYQNGWWASKIGGREGLWKGTSTSGDDIWATWTAERQGMWWTGITSLATDTSNIGFMQVDMRSGQAYLYKSEEEAGDTEDVILSRLNDLVQYRGWNAELPLRYYVYGHPTWIAPIVNEGKPQGIGVAHAKQPIQVYGNTLQDALRKYQSAVLKSGGGGLTADADLRRIKGKVLRVFKDTVDGNTRYGLYLVEAPTKVFTGTTQDLSIELALTEKDDSVLIGFMETNEPEVPIQHFDLLGVDIVPVTAEAQNK